VRYHFVSRATPLKLGPLGAMSHAEFLMTVATGTALAGYGAWLRWSSAAGRWFERQPPSYLRPVLVFWGLSPDAAGYVRMARGQGVVLVLLGAIIMLVALSIQLMTKA